MAATRRGGKRAPHQLAKVPWFEDQEVLFRLRIVEATWVQPINRIMMAVNEQVERHNRDNPQATYRPASYDMIKEDRRRVLEVMRERVLQPGKDSLIEHTMDLITLAQQAHRDALACAPGPQRAPLYAIALRCREDLMRIDGTWARGAAGWLEEGDQEHEERFAPNPDELLASGIVTQDDVKAHLRVLAARNRRRGSNPPLIEGEVLDAKAAPNLAPAPGSSTAATGTGPRRRKPKSASNPPAPALDLPAPNMNPNDNLDPFVPEPWE